MARKIVRNERKAQEYARDLERRKQRVYKRWLRCEDDTTGS